MTTATVRRAGAARGAASRTLAVAACCFVGLFALSVTAGAASAALPAQFGSEGEGAGQFAEPMGLAVDEHGGDLFVLDRGNLRVDSFTGEGGFLRAWGWGVADGTTDALQTCETTCFAGLVGAGSGQLGGAPSGVAVDDSLDASSGDVYVPEQGNARVEKFSPSGEFLLMFGGEVNKTAVEAHGSEAERNVCTVASGATCRGGASVVGDGSFGGLGKDVVSVGSTGAVYVGEQERVQKFSAGGVFEGEVALPGVGFVESLLVDSTGELYVMASGVSGVHKYDVTGTTATELGKPRDATAESSPSNIALGPAGELFVYNVEQQHVFEYDSAGAQVSSFPEHGGSRGLAYSSIAKALYVLHDSGVTVVVPPPPGPVVLAGSEAAGEVQPTTAKLEATVNPEGGAETTYSFQYVDHVSFESEGGFASPHTQESSSVELTGGAFEDQSDSAPIANLHARTVYDFRVVVTNAAHETTDGPDQTFTTAPPVSIDSQSVSQVTATSATLETELDPHGLPSTYHFEYDTVPYAESEGAGAHGISTPTDDAGSGTSDAGRSFEVQGLTPATLYHYRILATNELGTAVGPDRSFTTEGPAAGLPDGRGWELVSPPDKQGIPLEGISENGGPIQAAADGSGLAYIAKGPIEAQAPSNRSFATNQLLASRNSDGWSTRDIATPYETERGLTAGNLGEYGLFSSDLSLGAVEPEGATPLSSQTTERTPYLRQPGGEYTPLVTAANVPAGTKFGGEEGAGLVEVFNDGVQFVTATPSLGDVILSAEVPLTEGFLSSGEESLYEWVDGKLTLVSVLPNKHAAAEEGEVAKLGNADRQVRNAVSADGSRVVFQTKGEGHLYLRDIARAETVQLDVPQGVRPGKGELLYQDASTDGSRIFFTDTARLTAGATASEMAPDLYMCEVSVVAGRLTCTLEDLTQDATPNEASDVLGDVIGADNAGELVYFVANGALAAGSVHGDCIAGNASEAPPTAVCNLYVRDVAERSTKLVGVLSNHDALDWAAGGGEGTNLSEVTARVSPNGRYLAFMSQRSLTGYDNRDALSGQPDEEVFLYHAAVSVGETVTLRCASCNPTGARPVGFLESPNPPFPLVDRSHVWENQWLAASIPGWTRINKGVALYQSRYLDDSGRLFFDSHDALVPQDSNGTEDVYQYEGVGGPESADQPASNSCTTASSTYSAGSGGCVNLISSGASGQESAFLDASESGDDVFFLTASQLAPTDVDTALDVYDAHVCTAESPCPPPPPPPPPACQGDACQNPVAAPNDPTPGSLTFHGAGNLAPPAGKPTSKVKPPTRAQKLAKALGACKKTRAKAKKAACVKRARKLYGPVKKKSKAHKGVK